MPAQEKISVVIPTFNRKGFIFDTLDSVFRQTLPPHEIIVVDDGSTDGTEEALERAGYAERMTYRKIDHSGRPAVARNHGIRLATGDWVALLDSDDLWEPTKLQRQSELYAGLSKEDRASCGLIDTFTLTIDAETKAVITRLGFSKQGRCVDRILTGNYVNKTSSVMVKGKVFDQIGLFDETLKIGEDSEMWLRIAKSFSIFTVKEYLNRYMINPSSISKNIERQIEAHSTFVEFIDERHSDLGAKLVRRIISFRNALLLQHIYNSPSRDVYLTYFRRFFSEDRAVLLRSRKILPYALLSLLSRFSSNFQKP